MRRWSFLVVILVLAWVPTCASAAEIDVLSAGAVQKALQTLAADYQRQTGTAVHFTFGSVGQIEGHLKAGEAADIVILSAPALDALTASGALVPGSKAVLGRVGMGVAVKAGAPLPNIATPQAFKTALLKAPSIAYSDPAGGGSSGVFFDQLIQKLGIAEVIRAKAVLIRGGSATDPILQGKAAMAVQNASELIGVAGIRYVGPFPAADQNYIAYAGGVDAKSAQAKDAAAFLRFVTRPAAAKTWREAGFAAPAVK